jgi:anti-sigma regulatory factor (Ser/Thr protein kinase)
MDRWSISVPGVPSMVPVARLFVRAFLAGNPLAENAELITSEYATNAIRHTAAGEGGAIQVAVSAGPGLVRIEVTDHAPLEAVRAEPQPTGPVPQVGRAGEEDESGRGLLLVDAIADRWGHDGVAGHRTAWAEIRVAGGAGVAAGTG